MKSVKTLMKKNIFVNADGSIECVDAFIEMTAYYLTLIKMKKVRSMPKLFGQIDILKAMARLETYNWGEIYTEASKLANAAYAKAIQDGLVKAA